jgi:ribosomal-protein-alanine N-acetyltransferase
MLLTVPEYFPKLESERFYLRPVVEKDVNKQYCSWFKDSQVARYIVSSADFSNFESLKEYVRIREGKSDSWFCGVFEKKSTDHIANIKYEPIDFDRGSAVMGILIGNKSWRGCGLAEEVIKITSSWLRDYKGINSVYLGVKRSNQMAVKAYSKIGFVLDETGHLSVENDAIVMRLDTASITSMCKKI